MSAKRKGFVGGRLFEGCLQPALRGHFYFHEIEGNQDLAFSQGAAKASCYQHAALDRADGGGLSADHRGGHRGDGCFD